MTKPLGGRGQKAPYETVQVRTPVPIKPQVEALIAQYRESILSGGSTEEQSQSNQTFEDCLKLVDRFIEEQNQTQKLHTRNNVNLIKFRNWLHAQTNSNLDS